MKLIRYGILALLTSSPLCQGFTSASIKYASVGVGKLGLGLLCANAGMSVALMTAPDPALASRGYSPAHNSRNLFLLYAKDSFTTLSTKGVRKFLCKQKGFGLNDDLSMTLTVASMIGICAYGTCKCVASAGKSFKEAWYGRKKPSNQIISTASESVTTVPSKDTLKNHSDDGEGSNLD